MNELGKWHGFGARISKSMTLIQKNSAQKTLSESIENFHQMGFSNDYVLTADRLVSCLQDQSCYSYDQLAIQLVDHVFDTFAQRFCYLHTVTANDGQKGILLSYSETAKPKPRTQRIKQTTIESFWAVL